MARFDTVKTIKVNNGTVNLWNRLKGDTLIYNPLSEGESSLKILDNREELGNRCMYRTCTDKDGYYHFDYCKPLYITSDGYLMSFCSDHTTAHLMDDVHNLVSAISKTFYYKDEQTKTIKDNGNFLPEWKTTDMEVMFDHNVSGSADLSEKNHWDRFIDGRSKVWENDEANYPVEDINWFDETEEARRILLENVVIYMQSYDRRIQKGFIYAGDISSHYHLWSDNFDGYEPESYGKYMYSWELLANYHGIMAVKRDLLTGLYKMIRDTNNPKGALLKELRNGRWRFYGDMLVHLCGIDKIETTNSKTITTTCDNVYERFYNYMLMGWDIVQLPKWSIREDGIYKESWEHLWHRQMRLTEKEQMYKEEIAELKSKLSIKQIKEMLIK